MAARDANFPLAPTVGLGWLLVEEGFSPFLEHEGAYAVWLYWRSTGDDRFMLDGGAEILAETARFWASGARREAPSPRRVTLIIPITNGRPGPRKSFIAPDCAYHSLGSKKIGRRNGSDLIALVWHGSLDPGSAQTMRRVVLGAPCPVIIFRMQP